MTRLALLHPTYWPEVRRGSERYIHDLAAGLIAAGHEPELISSHPGPRQRIVLDGLPVRFAHRRGDAWLRRHRFDDHWTHVPASYRSLCRGDYELAHAFYPTDALAAARWSRRTGRPSIFSAMGIPNPLIRIRLDSQPRAARRASAVTVDSRAVADAFFYRWGIEPRVVHPGVDLSAFAAAPAPGGDPVILCPAPLGVARKRVDWLLEAFPAIRARWPRATLLLLRPDDEQLALRLSRADRGIELFDSVQAAGELAALYRRAWVTALPAWGEAFGMVLVESLACGRPVVAAARDAAPEIVDDPAVGRLFDDTRPESLAAALQEALALAAEPQTAAACRRRAARFSIERTLSAFTGLYAELLGDSPAGLVANQN